MGSAKPVRKEEKTKISEEEWEEMLEAEVFKILRGEDTEAAFSGDYIKKKEDGIYVCAGCGNTLFSSNAKFDSGTGWPSFWSPIEADVLETRADYSQGTYRTEVVCKSCEGHLGHVFDDGPEPSGLRYSVNSLALKFEKKDKE